MTLDRIARRVEDLARIGAEAAHLVAKGEDAYLADTMDAALLRDAGGRILIKVATVAEKLPAEFRTAHPDIDWSGISRMRNRVAHHYDKVNDDLMWRALTKRIPALVARVSQPVEADPGGGSGTAG